MAALFNKRETPGSKVQDWTRRGLLALGLPNYTANKWAHRITDPLLALTPLGLAEDATTESRRIAAENAAGRVVSPMRGGAALGALSALPAAKAAKAAADLPMDTASRMARARAMGFDVDTPLYHGTKPGTDIQEFAPSSFGAQGPGTYFTNNPNEAREYSRKAVKGGFEYGPVHEVRLALKNPFRAPVGSNVYDLVGVQSDEELIRTLKAAGFDGIEWQNAATPDWVIKAGATPMPQTTHYVVFPGDENKIRSVNAAFDPAKRNSANIMAGVAGAGVVGAGVMQQNPGQPKRERPGA